MVVCLTEAERLTPFFQAEDGIRDVERSRGLGDVYKRQHKILYKCINILHVCYSDLLRNFTHSGWLRNSMLCDS